MNRRNAVLALMALGSATFAALAQQPGKVWRVGVLALRARPASLDLDYVGAFARTMRDLGYSEGKNLAIEWRFAEGRIELLPELAAELVQLKVDVILANGTRPTGAAQKATSTIPIVMGNVSDPVHQGFVESLARPGRNITGLATITYEVGGKYLELLLAMAPKVSRVAFLSEFRGTNPMALKNIQAAGQRVGVTILPHEALSLQEIESVFSAMRKQNAQGLIIASTPIFYQQRRRIAELALAHRMPYVASYREYTEAGGLVSYGPSLGENYRRAATFVDKIFKGAKPADLPVEQPTTFELVINRMTAKALGLAIPKSLLISADTVIE